VATVPPVRLATSPAHPLPQSVEAEPLLEVVTLVLHAANPDPQDPAALLESQADQESLELQAFPATRASHHLSLVSQSLPHHANPVLKDLLDLLVHQAHQETLEPQDSQEAQARMLHPASQDQKDHPDLPDSQASQEPQESQEPQLRAAHQCPASQERQEMQDPQDHQDSQEPQARTEDPELQDPKDPPVGQDSQEAMASQASPDNPDPPEVQEKRASAPSTAPSMEESSSRMELADDKLQLPANCLSLNFLLAMSLYFSQKSVLTLC